MSTTNIFLNSYEQPENKLTYCFLALLEHVGVDIALRLLELAGFRHGSADGLTVSLVYGGAEGNLDGSIVVTHRGAEAKLFFENKTWRRPLDIDQLRRRIRSHMGASGELFLLIVSAERSDRDIVMQLNEPRALFTTWHAILDFALTAEAQSPKDTFLLAQFAEFLEKSEEAWRGGMLSPELIAAHTDYLRVAPTDKRFHNDCWRLIDAIKDDALRPFSTEIASSYMADRWGRIGVECIPAVQPLGQWFFFGVYSDPFDHGIKFRTDGEPEFAIFWDIEPTNRTRLKELAGIDNALAKLKQQGFEFNFPDYECGNPWRVCFWRCAMRDHVQADLRELARIFEDRLRSLIDSDFYKLARDASP
jgi:hypothetical protein